MTVVETAPTVELVLDDTPTVELCLPRRAASPCVAIVPFRPRPAALVPRRPAPLPETDLSGFFQKDCVTRELEHPRPSRNAASDLLEKRLWLVLHSLTVLVVGIVVGVLLGTFGR